MPGMTAQERGQRLVDACPQFPPLLPENDPIRVIHEMLDGVAQNESELAALEEEQSDKERDLENANDRVSALEEYLRECSDDLREAATAAERGDAVVIDALRALITRCRELADAASAKAASV